MKPAEVVEGWIPLGTEGPEENHAARLVVRHRRYRMTAAGWSCTKPMLGIVITSRDRDRPHRWAEAEAVGTDFSRRVASGGGGQTFVAGPESNACGAESSSCGVVNRHAFTVTTTALSAMDAPPDGCAAA